MVWHKQSDEPPTHVITFTDSNAASAPWQLQLGRVDGWLRMDGTSSEFDLSCVYCQCNEMCVYVCTSLICVCVTPKTLFKRCALGKKNNNKWRLCTGPS